MNFLTIEEAEFRINHETNHVLEKILRPKSSTRGKPTGHPKPEGSGRAKGQENISPYLRELISTSAQISGSTATAKAFGVGIATAQKAKNGVTSESTTKDGNRVVIIDRTLQQKTKQKMLNIADLASTIIEANLPRLSDELDAVTDKPKERASILKDIASIADKVMPKESAPQGNTVSFHFFKPEERSFDNVPVIDVTPIERK